MQMNEVVARPADESATPEVMITTGHAQRGGDMGIVQRIERKLEVTVGDVFARVFGGEIVPQEV